MTNNDLRFSLLYALAANSKQATFTDGNDDTSYDALITPSTISHSSVVGLIKATSPLGVMYGGTEYDAYDFSSPDIDGNTSDYLESGIDLDTDSTTGNVVNGDYDWDFMVRVNVPQTGGVSEFKGFVTDSFQLTAAGEDYATFLGAAPTSIKLQVYSAGAATGNEGVYNVTAVTYDGTDTKFYVSESITPFGVVANNRIGIIFTYSETLTYCFSADPATDINIVSDCFCSKITSTDNSNYEVICNGISVSPTLPLARSHKLYYPDGIFPSPQPIVAVSVGSKYFEIAGNYAAQITEIGYINVINSTGNDLSYTVSTALYNVGSLGRTRITVTDTPADATVDGQVELGVLEYGTAEVEITGIYTGTWTAYMEIPLVYVLPSGISVSVTVKGSEDHTVVCSDCLCCLMDCIKNIQASYESALSTGNARESARLEIVMQKIVAHYSLLLIAKNDCGDIDEMTAQLKILTALVNWENCNCPDSSTDNIPVKVIPICGDSTSGTGSSTIVVAGSGITVSSVVSGLTTTYTVTLGTFNVAWSSIIGTPTTIAGYGITDAWTKTELAAAGGAPVHWLNLSNRPSNVPSYVQLKTRLGDVTASSTGSEEQMDTHTVTAAIARDKEVLDIRVVFDVAAMVNANEVGIKFNGTKILTAFDGNLNRTIDLRIKAIVNSTSNLYCLVSVTGSGFPSSLSTDLSIFSINMAAANLIITTYSKRPVGGAITQKLFTVEQYKNA